MDTRFLWSNFGDHFGPIVYHPEELVGLTVRQQGEWDEEGDWDEDENEEEWGGEDGEDVSWGDEEDEGFWDDDNEPWDG
jgi:hypothetical protein